MNDVAMWAELHTAKLFSNCDSRCGEKIPGTTVTEKGVSAQKSGSMLMFHLKGFNQAAESFANILQMFTAPKIIYLIAHLFIN